MASIPVPNEEYLKSHQSYVSPELSEFIANVRPVCAGHQHARVFSVLANHIPAFLPTPLQDQKIMIMPNFQMDAVELHCGKWGPFRPNFPIEVPVWLALVLRKKGRCTVKPPDWMSPTNLNDKIKAEREAEHDDTRFLLAPPPHEHYIEIGKALLTHARQDFDNVDADAMEEKLGELQKVRWHKINELLKGTPNPSTDLAPAASSHPPASADPTRSPSPPLTTDGPPLPPSAGAPEVMQTNLSAMERHVLKPLLLRVHDRWNNMLEYETEEAPAPTTIVRPKRHARRHR